MKTTTYFKGDEAVYTGHVVTLHGGTFYEVIMLEGPHKGMTRVVKNAPPTELHLSPYTLPDGSIVLVDATAAKDARMIDYTLADGSIVTAFQTRG